MWFQGVSGHLTQRGQEVFKNPKLYLFIYLFIFYIYLFIYLFIYLVFMGSYEAKLGFPEKISVGGAWIFSGTTHCACISFRIY